jgi:uncharacterized OB-fold protein
MTDIAVAAHLAEIVTMVNGEPRLLGGRCGACATDNFPKDDSCPRCGSSDISSVTLAPTGTVWTWTVQRFAPKTPYRPPSVAAPFALGYVDLGTVKVEARLAGKSVESWKIGDKVHLVVGPMHAEDSDWEAFWFETTTQPMTQTEEQS